MLRGGVICASRALGYARVVVASCALLAATVTCVQATSISSVRSSAGSDYTRVVIDLSGKIQFRYGMIPADKARKLPPRLYVDLVGVRLDPKHKHDFWVGDARVSRVRTGQFTRDKARIVFDLEGPVEPTVFALETPPRVVVDFRGRGAASPAAVQLASKHAETSTSKVATAKPAAKLPAKTPARTAAKPAAKAPAKVAAKPTSRAKTGSTAKAVVEPAARPVVSTRRYASSGARRLRVVIDPGHGGRDPGAQGYGGGYEKDTVLDISKRLVAKIRRGLDADVFMTRQSDRYVSLAERKDLANRVEADLFVSIHANASKNKRLHGIETYYLKNTDDRATLRLASLENGVEMIIGGDVSSDADLSYIISDMVQGQKEADSSLAARYIQGDLVAHLQPRYHSVETLGVKQGPFLVLDGTYMPAVLVETGFITHNVEGRRLVSESYRDAIAAGIYRGIRRYFEDDRTAQLR